jgi:hypothetical protein
MPPRDRKGRWTVAPILELEYTPWPTATPAVRSAVAEAFAQAGVPIAREMTAAGADGPPPSELRWAPTHLTVRLLIATGGSDEASRNLRQDQTLWLRLANACAAVRQMAPTLPLGLQVHAGDHRTWYGWRPDDAVADVEAALKVLAASDAIACGGAHGWDRQAHCWVSL